MAKIERATASIFGASSGFQEIAEFGSLQAGTPTCVAPGTAANVETIQSLANWLGGWVDAVIGGNSPAIEDMNAYCYVMAYQIAYLLQVGIPEYDDDTTYYPGNIINVPIVIFTVTSANATVGATYTNNGATFTVLQTIAAGTRLVCYGNASNPAASGTLTKSAGTGDSSITFASNTKYSAQYVSVGNGHTGNAITNTTYWLPLLPAIGKPYQRLQANAAGDGNEYSYNAINAQSSEASQTIPAGYNLNTGLLTIPAAQTYTVDGSLCNIGDLIVLGDLVATGDVICIP
jgi:hypothetical protein